MKVGLWDYIKAAFNARPLGMFVAPNWVGLALFALLGWWNPAFLLIGAGLELAYLYALSTNKRFQRYVSGAEMVEATRGTQQKLTATLNSLSPTLQQRYHALERRCRAILAQQQQQNAALTDELRAQGEGLGRLLWIYLRLLATYQAFARLLGETINAERERESIEERIARIESNLARNSIADELRTSLTSQLEILRQRQRSQREAREKIAFLDAELTRVEEQVELVREQAVLSSDPSAVSARIDEIGSTLSGTNQWIRDQKELETRVDDVLEDVPPVQMLNAE
jgi:DNA mismatch repair ATPase MutS